MESAREQAELRGCPYVKRCKEKSLRGAYERLRKALKNEDALYIRKLQEIAAVLGILE